ncbi:MAG: DUF92 domain-containing protein, partial [bacterium]
ENNAASSLESRRQGIHMGVVLFAFLLPFLPTPWAFFLLFALVVHNVVLLPRYAPGLYRPDEHGLGGVVLYPLGIAALILFFPNRMEIVAGTWALLAIGDGLSTLIGRSFPLYRLPWNPGKSGGGLLAFVIGGTLACTILVIWANPLTGESAWILLICGTCALIAGVAESLLTPIDDNILIPIVAAPFLSILLTVQISAGVWDPSVGDLVMAFVLNAVVAAAAYFLRMVSMNGALGAAVIGIFVYILGEWAAYVLLLLLFVAEPLIVRLGIARTTTETDTSAAVTQRGSKHAVANFGLALLLTLVWVFTDGIDPLLQLMYVAALATAFSETIVCQFGAILDQAPFMRAAPNTDLPGMKGTLSTGGGLLAVAAAVIFVGCGSLLDLCEASLAPAAIIGATIGAWSKPIMIATAREQNLAVDEEGSNLVATFIGALSAAIFAYLLGGPWHS